MIAEPVYRVTEGETVVAEFPGSRLVTDCPRYSPDARESNAIRRSARRRCRSRFRSCRRRSDPAWTLQRLLSVADDRQQGVGVPAVRLDRSHEHRHRTRRRRRGDSDSRHQQGARAQDRLQRPVRVSSIRAWADESQSPRRRATSPAPARGRWRSPTASTSGIRRDPKSSTS